MHKIVKSGGERDVVDHASQSSRERRTSGRSTNTSFMSCWRVWIKMPSPIQSNCRAKARKCEAPYCDMGSFQSLAGLRARQISWAIVAFWHEADTTRCLSLVRSRDVSRRYADCGRLRLITRSGREQRHCTVLGCARNREVARRSSKQIGRNAMSLPDIVGASKQAAGILTASTMAARSGFMASASTKLRNTRPFRIAHV
jgi:hypothetical protein